MDIATAIEKSPDLLTGEAITEALNAAMDDAGFTAEEKEEGLAANFSAPLTDQPCLGVAYDLTEIQDEGLCGFPVVDIQADCMPVSRVATQTLIDEFFFLFTFDGGIDDYKRARRPIKISRRDRLEIFHSYLEYLDNVERKMMFHAQLEYHRVRRIAEINPRNSREREARDAYRALLKKNDIFRIFLLA